MCALASNLLKSNCRVCRLAGSTQAVLPRAVRPSAASALLTVREALGGRASSQAEAPATRFRKVPSAAASGVRSLCSLWPARGRQFNWCSCAISSALGSGFGSLAGGATQRTMHAGSVPLGALPNHSINRTCPGKPGHAGYLKR